MNQLHKSFHKVEVLVKYVLYLPDLHANLITVPKITEKDYKVVFTKECADIIDSKHQLLRVQYCPLFCDRKYELL